MNLMRRVFWFLNKFFMVPMFRLGFGPFVGNPITGYIMVIKNTGRITGKIRYSPVNYAIRDGNVYCMAGFGKVTHWYKNLMANPNPELILPSGPIAGVVEEVSDRDEAFEITRQIFKNTGLAALLEGLLPFKEVPDEKIEAVLNRAPILRFRPTGVGSGASDPSGWLWVTLVVLTLLVLYFLLR